MEELRRLADQGDAQAQFELGFRYAHGYGVSRDDQEAVKWYRQAAEQGHASAQFTLGSMFFKGQGVPKDYQEAVRWYRLAAEQGNEAAQGKLGTMYYLGQGVPKDYVLAHMWVNLAAAQGLESASEMRDHFEKAMTPDRLAEAQRLAKAWKPTGKGSGNRRGNEGGIKRVKSGEEPVVP